MCSGEKDRGKCSAGFISISELLKNSLPKLSFGCPFLDSTFGGGIYGDGITEICGESASGKTQLCLQLCLSAQCLAPRKGSGRPGAIFLATEDNFPSKRLEQLVRFSPVTKPYPNITPSDWTNNILVEHVAEFEQLLQTVRNKIPELLKTKEIRLLIIDSVAAIFRCYEKEQIKDRWRHLSLLGHALHDLSSQNRGLTVVCVNQVTSAMENDVGSASRSFASAPPLAPALGLTWSNLVNTRFLLSRLDRTITMTDSSQIGSGGKTWEATMRAIEVSLSPYLPNIRCDVVIDKTGFLGIL